MDLVRGHSHECLKTELDHFSVPPTQLSLEEDTELITKLFLAWQKVELSKTLLLVKEEVTNADGSNHDPVAKIGVVNNFLQFV